MTPRPAFEDFTRASQQMALAALQVELDGLIAFFAAFGPVGPQDREGAPSEDLPGMDDLPV